MKFNRGPRAASIPQHVQLASRNVHGNAREGAPKLYPRMALFAKEFTRDFNIKRAAIRAGYAPSGAYNCGFTLLRRSDVQELVNIELRKRAERVDVSIDRIAKYWLNLATVDPRSLIPKGACRFCWGVDFQYQYTLPELREARREHLTAQMKIKDQSRRVPFDEKGGDGYDRYREPNRECPACNGHGVYMVDLDRLSEDQAALIAGYTVSPTGFVTLKLRDQSRAMENLQTLLGYVKRPRPLDVFDPDEMTEAQLDAVLQAAIDRGLIGLPAPEEGTVIEHDEMADSEA